MSIALTQLRCDGVLSGVTAMKTKSAWNPNPASPLPAVQQDGDFPARRAAWRAWWASPSGTAEASSLLGKAERLQKKLEQLVAK